MKSLADCGLYAFVDTAYLQGREPELIAQQLCDGGADLIQLRAKLSLPDEVKRMAESILPVTRRAGVHLVINDHLSIARDIGAELCHLGQEDFFSTGFKHVSELESQDSKPKTRNPNPRIGLSTHAPDQARRAAAAGAAYLAVGPVYPTGTKPGVKAVTVEYVRWAAANVTIPWFAIGGIDLSNLDEVLTAGAKRICVVSAILNQEDVKEACADFRKRLG